MQTKSFLPIIVLLLAAFSGRAQVFYFYGQDNTQLAQVRVAVTDSTSAEPIPFASVYLTEKKDSTIANFTLTDAEGKATLKDVPFGVWLLHVEMLGYQPFVKEFYFKKRLVEPDPVRLQIDEQFIRAARVTDVGNPIVIKKDTLEYNASSFQVGSNAVLKDLLAKMPGIEFTSEGKVKVNGEEVSRITVNGKTFFFDDQAMALENLPAAVVDKIRVIDRKSEQTRATGVEDGKREKVMDVALKKEYESGWFGNIGLKGGATVDGGEKELRDNRGFLFKANALASTYNPNDQLTLIANGWNIEDDGRFNIYSPEIPTVSGLSTQASAGVNVATTRIKDIEASAAATYKFKHTDAASKTLRTTFREDGDLLSENTDNNTQEAMQAGGQIGIKKETGKLIYNFSTQYNWSRVQTAGEAAADTRMEELSLNHSDRRSGSDITVRNVAVSGSVGMNGLGKPGRAFHFSGTYRFSGAAGTSWDWSDTRRGTVSEELALWYNRRRDENNFNANLSYLEPLGERWRVGATGAFSGSLSKADRDAFRDAARTAVSADAYYTTLSDSRYYTQGYGVSAIYSHQPLQVSLELKAVGTQNHLISESYGVSSDTGARIWSWYLQPEFNLNWTKDSKMLYFDIYTYQGQPDRLLTLPSLDISDPTRISAGNIYLQPSRLYNAFFQTRFGFPKHFASLIFYLYGMMTVRPEISAMWYDTDGIRYSVPVNARKPRSRVSANISYNTALNKDRTLSLSADLSGSFNATPSYHAVSAQPAFDRNTEDYTALMARFWGDASGSRFYSGESGFAENVTNDFHTIERLHLKYNKGPWSLTFGLTNALNYAVYTLPGAENVFTSENRIGMAGRYLTPHKFEISTELNYNFFFGYAPGYGQPEWHWDMTLSKSIGAFTLSLTGHDILGQTRNLSHIDAADYVQDSYRLIMGRYLLFGVKWNFGKMNALQNRRAQQAANSLRR